MFSDAPIMANLFGHGNIMALSSNQEAAKLESESGDSLARDFPNTREIETGLSDRCIKMWCVAQYSNHI